MATINSKEILFSLKEKLHANIPLRAGGVFFNIDNVRVILDGVRWDFRYEPTPGMTTCLAAYADGVLARAFENEDQVISYFYTRELLK